MTRFVGDLNLTSLRKIDSCQHGLTFLSPMAYLRSIDGNLYEGFGMMLKSLRFSHVLLVLTVWMSSTVASAFTIRCNAQQSICEITTNRLAVGDKVAVFNDDSYLVAVGTVKKIDGQKRLIRMTKSFGVITAGDKARFIEDNKAQNPESHFRVLRMLPKRILGAELGIISIGAGDQLPGLSASAYYGHRLRDKLNMVGGIDIISAAGTASDKLRGLDQTDVSAFALAMSGGLSGMIWPNSSVSLELSGRLGLAWLSLAISDDGYEPQEVLNDRLHSGFGLYARGKAQLIYHWGKLTPGIGLVGGYMHNASFTSIVGSLGYDF